MFKCFYLLCVLFSFSQRIHYLLYSIDPVPDAILISVWLLFGFFLCKGAANKATIHLLRHYKSVILRLTKQSKNEKKEKLKVHHMLILWQIS